MSVVPENLVITIGAMKAGTSSLHQYMGLHPSVFMTRTKELNFFIENRTWSKGTDWYGKQFHHRAVVNGESSVNYTKWPLFDGVPERINRVAPHTKFIYVLREPVARALSHYVHNVAHGREQRGVEEALLEPDNNYIRTSSYALQLERYLPYFDIDRFLIVDQKDLRDRRRAVLARVFAFIGVDPDFVHQGFDAEHHASASKGRPNRAGRALMALPGGKALRSIVPRLFEQSFERPKLSEAGRARLAEELAGDAQRLFELTEFKGRDWTA